MLERKRLAKHYQVVPGEEEADLELGEGVGAQTSGTTSTAPVAPSLADEVDNWDENIEDAWDEEEEHAAGTDSAEGDGLKTPSASSAGEVEAEGKKNTD